jgi:hypothetical protein
MEHTALYIMDSISCGTHLGVLVAGRQRVIGESEKIDNYWRLKMTIGARKGRKRLFQDPVFALPIAGLKSGDIDSLRRRLRRIVYEGRAD